MKHTWWLTLKMVVVLWAGITLILVQPIYAEPPSTVTTTQAEAEALDRTFAETEGPYEFDGPSLSATFFKMIVVLSGVCLLAYLVVGKLLPRVLNVPLPTAGRRIMSVVDRLPIDHKSSLLIVRMGEQHFLISHSEQGMNLVARLDDSEVRDALTAAEAEVNPPAWTGWTSLLQRRRPEDTL